MALSRVESFFRPNYYCDQKNKSGKYLGLSPRNYWFWLYKLDDEYLTEWEVVRMRNIHQERSIYMFALPALVGTGVWYASPYILGIHDGFRPRWKPHKALATLALGLITFELLNYRILGSKNFHELLTQPEPRGAYIRTSIKEFFPNQWKQISYEMHKLGYNFVEMNEYSGKSTMPKITSKFDDSRL